MTVNRNALDWSIFGREALYIGALAETNTFFALLSLRYNPCWKANLAVPRVLSVEISR